MSIKIRQMCDCCGRDRELAVSATGRHDTLEEAANSDGWRKVAADGHLCPWCIGDAIGRPIPVPKMLDEDTTKGPATKVTGP